MEKMKRKYKKRFKVYVHSGNDSYAVKVSGGVVIEPWRAVKGIQRNKSITYNLIHYCLDSGRFRPRRELFHNQDSKGFTPEMYGQLEKSVCLRKEKIGLMELNIALQRSLYEKGFLSTSLFLSHLDPLSKNLKYLKYSKFKAARILSYIDFYRYLNEGQIDKRTERVLDEALNSGIFNGIPGLYINCVLDYIVNNYQSEISAYTLNRLCYSIKTYLKDKHSKEMETYSLSEYKEAMLLLCKIYGDSNIEREFYKNFVKYFEKDNISNYHKMRECAHLGLEEEASKYRREILYECIFDPYKTQKATPSDYHYYHYRQQTFDEYDNSFIKHYLDKRPRIKNKLSKTNKISSDDYLGTDYSPNNKYVNYLESYERDILDDNQNIKFKSTCVKVVDDKIIVYDEQEDQLESIYNNEIDIT